MSSWQLHTPVAFVLFNRPEMVARVFAAIRQAQPPKLLLIADGPRPERPGEAERCAAARAIAAQVDWDCEVLQNYSDQNLGCRTRLATGLTWVFEQVEEAIILEDDCLPHLSFFRFCEELLEHYRSDRRIMHISGNNFQFGRQRTDASYYFSRHTHCWGWATWRRAWQLYDAEMQHWPQVREGDWLPDLLGQGRIVRDWQQRFESVYDGSLDTWDYQWTFSCWINNGLSILPAINLVTNIGFTAAATHTSRPNQFANLPATEMAFPLRHPEFVVRDRQADDFTERSKYSLSLLARLQRKLHWHAWLSRFQQSQPRSTTSKTAATARENGPEAGQPRGLI